MKKEELENEIEQLRVQLAGCLTAAEGFISKEHIAYCGDYGWSPAYQAVLDLRIKHERLLAQNK